MQYKVIVKSYGLGGQVYKQGGVFSDENFTPKQREALALNKNAVVPVPPAPIVSEGDDNGD